MSTSELKSVDSAPVARPPIGMSFGSGKIEPHHTKRNAIVYIRQSSPQQVQNNRESRERQYALADMAEHLGWEPVTVEVIDDDQGTSGKRMDHRFGFQRLMSEVGLDHVGIVIGLEMSRLARSNKDWHQLLELCAVFRTLLADQDGVYDPRDHNDRLLLGLRGMMSEAELHVIRSRLHEGKLNKARRGELFPRLPPGYVKADGGEVIFDPDEQVQSTIRLILCKFEELGSASAVLRYMVSNGVQATRREHTGLRRGELCWIRPRVNYILDIIHHPIYAGAYVYGRRTSDPKQSWNSSSSRSTRMLPREEWEVLIPDKLPAYISWEQYETNQKQLEQNRAKISTLGAARNGLPILGGLVVCGRCGHRMVVAFKNKKVFRYICCQEQLSHAAPRCQSFAGRVLDELVSEKVLAVLEPASIELSVQAADEIQLERDRLDKLWKQKLERARFESERAARQFNAVEPENRLVGRELERRWEESLKSQASLEKEYEQQSRRQPTKLSDEELKRIRTLSSSIPALWHAPQTTPADRQLIVRQLVERVRVSVDGDTEVVNVSIEWVGGYTSNHEIRRPVFRYEQLRDFEQLRRTIEELTDTGLAPMEVAEELNTRGFHPPNRVDEFTGRIVGRFLRENCRRGSKIYKLSDLNEIQPGEWLLKDLAKELKVAEQTLHGWRRKGWITGRQISGHQSHWILWGDSEELNRLQRLCKLTYKDRPVPERNHNTDKII